MWRLKVTADAGEAYTALREEFERKYIREEDDPATGGRTFQSRHPDAYTTDEEGNAVGVGLRAVKPTTRATTDPGVSEQFRAVQKSLQSMLGTASVADGAPPMFPGAVTITCAGEPGEKLSLQVEAS